MKQWKIILQSMTHEELMDPSLLGRERIERIAQGSGCAVKDVRELLKQYQKSKKVMKMMKGKSPEKLMKKLGGVGKKLQV
jgi:signal recognition particle subunit SRP54